MRRALLAEQWSCRCSDSGAPYPNDAKQVVIHYNLMLARRTHKRGIGVAVREIKRRPLVECPLLGAHRTCRDSRNDVNDPNRSLAGSKSRSAAVPPVCYPF